MKGRDIYADLEKIEARGKRKKKRKKGFFSSAAGKKSKKKKAKPAVKHVTEPELRPEKPEAVPEE